MKILLYSHAFSSVIHHATLRGWAHALRESLKLGVRRMLAKHLVMKNVAITKWHDQVVAE